MPRMGILAFLFVRKNGSAVWLGKATAALFIRAPSCLADCPIVGPSPDQAEYQGG